MNKYRVAAYGTLKVGHGNWSYFFSGCECLVELTRGPAKSPLQSHENANSAESLFCFGRAIVPSKCQSDFP